ncbi:unnamed protein product, partial [marine sediment metagenome]
IRRTLGDIFTYIGGIDLRYLNDATVNTYVERLLVNAQRALSEESESMKHERDRLKAENAALVEAIDNWFGLPTDAPPNEWVAAERRVRAIRDTIKASRTKTNGQDGAATE